MGKNYPTIRAYTPRNFMPFIKPHISFTILPGSLVGISCAPSINLHSSLSAPTNSNTSSFNCFALIIGSEDPVMIKMLSFRNWSRFHDSYCLWAGAYRTVDINELMNPAWTWTCHCTARVIVRPGYRKETGAVERLLNQRIINE